MNKRLFGISLLLIIASFSYGQLTFDGWSQGYLGVYSYSGADMSGAITLNIQYTGTDLYEPNSQTGRFQLRWSLLLSKIKIRD